MATLGPDGWVVDPPGGTTGQVLVKQSSANGDVQWDDPPAGTGAAAFNSAAYGIYPSAGANTIAWTYDSNAQAFFSAAVYAPA